MFFAGQQIGAYVLVKLIGRGGFGEVWLSERRTKFVTTKVAVKLPLEDQVDHDAIRMEASLWEQASGHPNILPIIEADECDGQIVIVSEYAPDGSLEQRLRKDGKLSVERATDITIQILDGLQFLHSRSIIHRDLKPANILLQGNTPRLADFGISRALRTTLTTKSQFISGTIAYMSPEALDGKRSVQTDIWSVGVNLYEFLTGKLPFPQKETSSLCHAIVMREPDPLPDSVSPELRRIVATALAKDPDDRYQSADAMRQDLQRLLYAKPPTPTLASPQIPPDGRLSNNFRPGPQINKFSVSTDTSDTETIARPLRSKEAREKAPGAGMSRAYLLAIPAIAVLLGVIMGSAFLLTKYWRNEDYLALGSVCMAARDYDCAIGNYSKAIKAKPDYAEAYSARGLAYVEKEKYDEASADCNNAIRLNPDLAEAYLCRGRVTNYHENFDQSFKDCDKALELKSEYAEGYACRGVAAYGKENLAQALQDCNKAISLKPDFARAYNCRGIVYVSKDDRFDEAIAEFDRAIAIEPDFARAYTNRGFAYYKKNNIKRAFDDWNKAIELKSDPVAYRNLGWYYTEKGDYEKAFSACDKAVKLRLDYGHGYECRARVYLRQNNYDKAIEDYSRVIEIKPEASAYYGRAEAHFSKKEYSQAIADFSNGIKLKPTAAAYVARANAHFNLEQYDQSIEDYDEAIELSPNDAESYKSRGDAHYNKHEYDQAIADYRKALKLDPKLAEAKEYLQKALTSKGQ